MARREALRQQICYWARPVGLRSSFRPASRCEVLSVALEFLLAGPGRRKTSSEATLAGAVIVRPALMRHNQSWPQTPVVQPPVVMCAGAW
jgi:hypothetical protein